MKNDTTMTKVIRRQMVMHDITVVKLAKRLCVSRSTVERWVHHPERLTLLDWQRVNAVLHLDGEVFLKYGGFTHD